MAAGYAGEPGRHSKEEQWHTVKPFELGSADGRANWRAVISQK